ncbi:MAG: type II toxin-antitoxin system RelE/ParE family toxin [Phycisphaeraceae bacterium]
MEVVLSDASLAQFQDLPVSIRARVAAVLARLERWPAVSGVKWLTGDWKHHARIRTGDYRVVFHLHSDDLIIVDRIAHRRDAYFE